LYGKLVIAVYEHVFHPIRVTPTLHKLFHLPTIQLAQGANIAQQWATLQAAVNRAVRNLVYLKWPVQLIIAF